MNPRQRVGQRDSCRGVRRVIVFPGWPGKPLIVAHLDIASVSIPASSHGKRDGQRPQAPHVVEKLNLSCSSLLDYVPHTLHLSVYHDMRPLMRRSETPREPAVAAANGPAAWVPVAVRLQGHDLVVRLQPLFACGRVGWRVALGEAHFEDIPHLRPAVCVYDLELPQ